MSPPAVATESADGQPEQPTAAAAIAEELEKKLQVTLSWSNFVFSLSWFCKVLR